MHGFPPAHHPGGIPRFLQGTSIPLKKQYEFDSIYLYGSILSKRFGRHSDIDIIIKGLKINAFFKAYAFLIKESTYRIDLKPFEDMTADFQSEVLTKGIKIG